MTDTNTQPRSDSYGLKWVRTLWAVEPRWTIDPDTAAIATTVKNALNVQDECEVDFLAGGAFNKLYLVRYDGKEVIARVTLPVDPKLKTASEVATLQWVRQNTSLPVPEVLAFQDNRDSPIGFEWIIMSKVPGRRWADAWKDIPMPAKEQLVRRIASFYAETFARQVHGIGSLFPVSRVDLDPEPTNTEGENEIDNPSDHLKNSGFSLQKLVSATTFANENHATIPRGPFSTSREWLSARLDIAEDEHGRRLNRLRGLKGSVSDKTTSDRQAGNEGAETQDQATDTHKKEAGKEEEEVKDQKEETQPRHEEEQSKAKNASVQETSKEEEQNEDDSDEDSEDESDVEDEIEDLELTMSIISRLKSHLDEFFPAGSKSPEPTVIYHGDMNRSNILVDEAGALTAVVDWECVSAMPLFVACQFPPFMENKPNEIEPIKSGYPHDEAGEVDELYWEHLETWQLTKLRKVFLDEMRRLQPEWVAVFESSQRQRDFHLGVAACASEFLMRRISAWLDDLDSGVEGVRGLEDRIYNPFD